MSNEFFETALNTACIFAKHRGDNTLQASDISLSLDKNYGIVDYSKLSQYYNKLKSNEIRNVSTADHKRRLELTREESKHLI